MFILVPWPLQQLQVDEYEAESLLRTVGLDQICGEHGPPFL